MTAPRVPLAVGGDPDKERIRQNVSKMQAGGASPDEVEHYLRDVEGMKPATPDNPTPARAPTPKPSALDAITAGASQGLTLGFSDELMGAANALGGLTTGHTNLAENYAAGRDAERERLRQIRTEWPKLTTATELAAGIVPALATGGGSAPVTARALLGAGAKFGAVAGLGGAEGSLGKQAAQTAGGAVGGAALGYVGGKAAGKLSEVLTGVAAPRRAALAKLAEKFDQDQLTATSLGPTIAEAQATGKPVKVVDLGKSNVKQAARAVADAPGEGQRVLRQTLEDRIGDKGSLATSPQAARVKADVNRAFNVPSGDVDLLDDAIVAARRAHAKPLYDAAYAHGPVDLPVVRATFDDPNYGPVFREAHDEGVKFAQMEGQTIPQSPSGELTPTVQTLDYMKRGLDAVIEKKRAGQGMSKNEARLLRQRMNTILTDLDAAVPDYAVARNAYRGDSGALEALREGRDLGVTDAAGDTQKLATGGQIGRHLASKTPNEQTLYRVGAADRFARRIDSRSDHLDPVGPLAGDDMMRERVMAVAPDAASGQDLITRARWERAMRESRDAVTGGSGTSRNQAGLADQGLNLGDAAQMATSVGHGNPLAALLTAAKSVHGARSSARAQAEGLELAKLLTADPSLLSGALRAGGALRRGSPLALALARLAGQAGGDMTRVVNP